MNGAVFASNWRQLYIQSENFRVGQGNSSSIMAKYDFPGVIHCAVASATPAGCKSFFLRSLHALCQNHIRAMRKIGIAGNGEEYFNTYDDRTVSCGSLPVLRHAVAETVRASYASYKCSKGYVKSGSGWTARCRNGKWSHPTGKCKVLFKKPIVVGKFKDRRLTDVSGLAASRRHPGYLYSHNDYHCKPELFLISIERVKVVVVYTLTGAKNQDWEDIAVGPCELGKNKGDSCIFIGDFGGHEGGRSIKPANIIYKVKEPSQRRSMYIRVEGKLHFSWHASDANTLLVTPSGYIYGITSYHRGGYIYYFSRELFGHRHTVKAQKLHRIHIRDSIKGGDLSPDGSSLVLKTDDGFYYWEVEGEHVGAATADNKPSYMKTKGMYGGGVAFNLNSSGVYVLNEDVEPLYFFARRGMN